jgi:single-stranded-DNA-specific exonuclease
MGLCNERRKQIQARIIDEAHQQASDRVSEDQTESILFLGGEDWHQGVVGIAASRIAEDFWRPTWLFQRTADLCKGSARSIPGFDVTEAMSSCGHLFKKFGGHRAAGGFSLPSQNLAAFQERLSTFANQCLEPEQLKPLIKIDAQANFYQLTFELCQQVEQLQPWGIGNEFPIFWTPQVRILEQRIIGKNHLRLELLDSTSQTQIGAIAWRWGEYFPLPSPVDIAYKLQENHFKSNTTLQLELVGIRLPLNPSVISKSPTHFDYQGRIYRCSYNRQSQELKIQNDQGKVLALQLGQTQGLMGSDRATAKKVNLDQAPYAQLIALARATLSC